MSLREDSQKAIEAAQHYEATEAMPTWARVALISAMTEHATVLLLASDEMFCLMTGK